MQPINIEARLSVLHERWAPHTVAGVNDHDLRLVTVAGGAAEADGPDSVAGRRRLPADVAYLVLTGCLTVRSPGVEVTLAPGELHVAPAGTEHRLSAERETSVLLVERHGQR